MSRDNMLQSTAGTDEHPFEEPWQAQAFAMAVALHEKGVFSWREWSETIGKILTAAGPDDDPNNYYRHWMKALETLVDAKNVAASDELVTRKGQWDRAARATPHGTPINLEADPLFGKI